MYRSRLLLVLLSLLLLLRADALRAEDQPQRPLANRAEVRASFELDAGAEGMLRQNGFVVLDGSSRPSLHEAYPAERKDGLPLLVTTDAMLALWYELSRSLVSEAERRKLCPELSRAVASLHRTGERMRSHTASGPAHRALRGATISLAVADRLLGSKQPVAADLLAEVTDNRSRIMVAREVGTFPREDFTQYRVRGHYTQSPELSRYFRGSMWLSRRLMPVERQPGTEPDAPLRNAIALAAILRADPAARSLLRSMVSTRRFLVGTPNAISLEEVVLALDRVHGPRWTLETALTSGGLGRLRHELGKKEYVTAKVWTRPTAPGTKFPQKVIALLPDGAVPDSRLFQATMHPSIVDRELPTPLEVGAGLGLLVARQEVRNTDPQAAAVLRQVDRVGPLGKPGEPTLYNGWLQVLRSLQSTDARAPRYLRSVAWQYKTLNTSLASWAQLRHTSLLYAAQAYGGGLGMTFSEPEALVEPIPAFYRSLRALAQQTRAGLAGSLSPSSSVQLRRFETKCGEFARFAEAELAQQLKPEQARSIGEFGRWLATFPVVAEPVVVDVATGSTGEVLHAATGSFNPLLVVPEPKNGLAYCGWVMSYYEVRQQGYQRLTDADWKSTLASQYLRPQRPGWTEHFVARPKVHAAPEREPLRRAEALFLEHRPAEAIAVLRAVVGQERLSPVATEAQLRLGRYYFDQKEFRQAADELRRCERMYGCAAADEARRLLLTAQDQLRPAEPEEDPRASAPLRDVLRRIAALRTAPKGPASQQQEEQLVRQLLELVAKSPRDVDPELLSQGATVCRQDVHRWLLRYAALFPRVELGRYSGKADEVITECLTFSRGDAPRPLRAGAMALAVHAGLDKRDPERSLRLLRPFRRPDVFRPHPTLTWIRSLPQQSFILPLDPAPLLDQAVQVALPLAFLRAFQRGDWQSFDALRADLLPAEIDPTSRNLRLLFSEFGDQNTVPLRRFVEANGQESRGGPRLAATAFATLSRLCPTARLAPYALWRAQECAERAKELEHAEQLRTELIRNFPGSYPAAAARVRQAVEQWEPETALPIDEQTRAAGAQLRELNPYFRLPEPSSLQFELDRVARNVAKVRPLLKPGQRPVIVRQLQSIRDLTELDDKLGGLFPERQPEVYLGLMEVDYLSSLTELFLRRYPDHPEAKKAWRGFYFRSLSRHLPWLTPLVERGTTYRWEREARSCLEHLIAGNSTPEDNEAAYVAWVREHVAEVLETGPGTRSAAVAQVALSRALLGTRRPEAALKVIQGIQLNTSNEDPLEDELNHLKRRARLEIAGKSRPDWVPRWRTHVQPLKSTGDSRAAAATADAGLLLVPATFDQNQTGIVALDEATGRVRWTATTAFPASLVSDGEGHCYVGTTHGSLVCLASSDGRKLFERQLATQGPIKVRVAAAKGVVLAWGGGEIHAFQSTMGEPLWRTSGNPLRGHLELGKDRVFLVDGDCKLTALNLHTGRMIWTRDFGQGAPAAVRLTAVFGAELLVLHHASGIEILDSSDGRTRGSLLYDQATGRYQPGTAETEFALIVQGVDSSIYLQSRVGGLTAKELPEGLVLGDFIYEHDDLDLCIAVDAETRARVAWTRDPLPYDYGVNGGEVLYFIDNGSIAAFPKLELPATED